MNFSEASVIFNRFGMLNVSQNSENLSKLDLFYLSYQCWIINVKSLAVTALPCLLMYLYRRFHRPPKKVSIFELQEGLSSLKITHLLILMVISDNIIPLFNLFVTFKDFQIKPFLIYSINPQRFCFYPVVFEFHTDL